MKKVVAFLILGLSVVVVGCTGSAEPEVDNSGPKASDNPSVAAPVSAGGEVAAPTSGDPMEAAPAGSSKPKPGQRL